MISFRQADLMQRIDDDKRVIIWTLVFYNGPKGDSVDSQIKFATPGHILSTFLMHALATIQAGLERSWDVNGVREIDLDSDRYKTPIGKVEKSVYKNSADAVGNTLTTNIPYYFKGKKDGGVLPSGAVYVTYKVRDAKYPAGTPVKFTYDGKEFHGIVKAVLGNGQCEIQVNEEEAADLADSNVSNPVKLNEAESWLERA